MSNKQTASMDEVRKAISDLVDAALPVAKTFLDALQANADKISQTGKALLDVLHSNTDALATTAKGVANVGVNVTDSVSKVGTSQHKP